MREYAMKLDKLGISYDRYQELKHFCRQYDRLSVNGKKLIDEAAKSAAGEYAQKLKLNVCTPDTPFRYIDIPYSESQFKRIRKMFFVYLDKSKEK